MARLPTIGDLGQTPRAAPTRPVAGYDTGGLSRAAQSVGQAGQAFGRGLAEIGQGIAKAGEGLADYEIGQARWDYAKAHSDLVVKTLDAEAGLKHDTNYGADDTGKSMPDRYGDRLTGIQQESAGLIANPRMRERFLADTAPTIERGRIKAAEHARSLERDANLTWIGQQGDAAIDKALAAGDDGARATLIDSHNALIDGAAAKGWMTPAQALAAKKEWAQRYATAELLSLIDKNPGEAVRRMESAGRPTLPSAGLVEPGNIDLATRPVAKNPDGTISTVRSMSVGIDGREVLIPTIGDDGKPLSDEQAVALYRKTGRHLGQFDTPGNATAYAKALHEQQAFDHGETRSSVYAIIPPERRYQLLHQARVAAKRNDTLGVADLKNRVDDATAEAARTGGVTNPIPETEFKARLGDQDGARAYAQYQSAVQLGADVATLATLDPAEQRAMVERYTPKPGEGFREQAQRQDTIFKALAQVNKAKAEDPAGFAIQRLPASGQAWNAFTAVLSDPTADGPTRHAAAKRFADVTLAEQARVGIAPTDRRIVPQSYVDGLVDRLNAPAAAGGSLKVAKAIEAEADLWGDRWDDVYAAAAPKAGSLFRVVGSGIASHAAQALVDDQAVKAIDILRQQDAEKFSVLRKEVMEKLQPFARSLAGSKRDVTYQDFRDATEKLAAIYVSRGATADDAATRAFADLIGRNYEFRDTYRIPTDPRKKVPATPDVIEAGAAVALTQLDRFDVAPRRDDRGGLLPEYLQRQTIASWRRDGRWATAPDESGLTLIDPKTGFAAPRRDGSPLVLTWAELAGLAQARRDTIEAAPRDVTNFDRLMMR